MVLLFCVIIGETNNLLGVAIGLDQSVGDLKEAIHRKKRHQFPADELQLFLAKKKKSDKWLTEDEAATVRVLNVPKSFKPMKTTSYLKNRENFGWNFQSGEDQIHVLVVLPVGSDIVWYGKRGFDLEDPRTLSRSTVTTEIIRQLEEKDVLMVNSPPMTGKTSLAALVSRSLVNEIENTGTRKVVFSFSALPSSENESFEENFERQCGVDWNYATSTLPTEYEAMVYLVLDEIQELYYNGRSPPRCKSTCFWPIVKYKLGDAGYKVRILMFAAYGCDVVYLPPTSPLSIDERCILGIDDLIFSRDEVFEYVTKWFKGISC